ISHRRLVTADESSHLARCFVTSRFHELTARRNQLQTCLGLESSRHGMCGKLAQRKTRRSDDRKLGHGLADNAPHGEAMQIKRRLAVDRLRQLFQRTAKGQLSQRAGENTVSFRKDICCRSEMLRQIPTHSNLLRALSGKEECDTSRHGTRIKARSRPSNQV